MEETGRPAINPWLIAATVMLATFMEVLDTSVANVALPNIAGSLSAGVDESTWVLTSYLVANAIVLPLSGWFSTLFGRKRFYMACVAIFTVSSLLCGIAPSLPLLIVFRVLQGLGGGALQPISQAILVESFPPEKQGVATAFYGMGVVVAPVIGPTLGGWMTDNFSWRWIFLINIPFGVLSILLTSALIADPAHFVRKTFKDGLKLDYIGLGLLATGLAALEIMLDEGQREDWFSSGMIVAAALIAVSALVAVVFWELRQPDPVVDFRVLKNRNFAVAAVTMYAVGFTLYGSTALLPIFLQTILGYTALLSGLVLSPGGVAMMIGFAMVGRLLGRLQARSLIVFGLIVSSLGVYEMSGFNLNVDFRTAMWMRTLQAFGMAFLFVPINVAAFSAVPREQLGYATGLMNLFRNIGGSAGIAMVTTLLARRQQFHQETLVSHVTPLDPGYGEMLRNTAAALVAKGTSAADAALQAQGVVYGTVQKHAAMMAVTDTFWILALVFLAMVPIVMMLKKTPRVAGPVPME
ncbi:MAG TPA: DHA2 family efflux MFS transporter permease subunit [Vicinamibacterales bacterium]|nr:DHA2 family efflux MFS transporter permease subunit [Vicinamibacterales bacterium]